ncbi:uncharacterized protein LY79DRAFT_571747 [Colletotrichum navitas]|uniref:Uncharacterized protein n=1 Tax=Colletotrichum navitas TaxID=681940 RepID=A0AAD8PLI8_9PEZI|nr:uncharacterized protein LY79DRAFT_571747 [Colletotrichum navitas]KAK1569514.1 hypothetical protein LY79DRAFT_571747 [Colletotrichum navitas]
MLANLTVLIRHYYIVEFHLLFLSCLFFWLVKHVSACHSMHRSCWQRHRVSRFRRIPSGILGPGQQNDSPFAPSFGDPIGTSAICQIGGKIYITGNFPANEYVVRVLDDSGLQQLSCKRLIWSTLSLLREASCSFFLVPHQVLGIISRIWGCKPSGFRLTPHPQGKKEMITSSEIPVTYVAFSSSLHRGFVLPLHTR